MPSNSKNWKFTEEQRPAVCNGELCPACLSDNVMHVGDNPDGMHTNSAYDCMNCGEQWEGY